MVLAFLAFKLLHYQMRRKKPKNYVTNILKKG